MLPIESIPEKVAIGNPCVAYFEDGSETSARLEKLWEWPVSVCVHFARKDQKERSSISPKSGIDISLAGACTWPLVCSKTMFRWERSRSSLGMLRKWPFVKRSSEKSACPRPDIGSRDRSGKRGISPWRQQGSMPCNGALLCDRYRC